MSTPHTIDLECPSCQKRYKLVPNEEKAPPQGITCPHCAALIPTDHDAPQMAAPEPVSVDQLLSALAPKNKTDISGLFSLDDNEPFPSFLDLGDLDLSPETPDLEHNTLDPDPEDQNPEESSASLLEEGQLPEDLPPEPGLRPLARPLPPSLGELWSASSIYDIREQAPPPEENLPDLKAPLPPPAAAIRVAPIARGTHQLHILSSPPPRPSTRSARPVLLLALLLSLVLLGSSLGMWTPYGPFGHRMWNRKQTLANLGTATLQHMPTSMRHTKTRAAISHASNALHHAALLHKKEDTRLAHLLQKRSPLLSTEALQSLAQKHPSAAALQALYIDRLVEENRYQNAREHAHQAILHTSSPALSRSWTNTHRSDPAFFPPHPRNISWQEIRGHEEKPPLTVHLIAPLVPSPVRWLQPSTEITPRAPRRAEIRRKINAVFLLEHPLPDSEEVRLSWPPPQDPKESNATETETAPPAWQLQATPRAGRGGIWLPGVLHAPGKPGVPFPIEDKSLWGSWLSLESSEIPMRSAAEELLSMEGAQRLAVSEVLGERSTTWLAAKISQLLVMDYLLGDEGRFAPKLAEYGSTLTLTKAGFVPAPQRQYNADAPEAWKHLQKVERFSRTTIKLLETLEEKDLTRLTASPGGLWPGDVREAQDMYKRRTKLLQHVHHLIERRGEKRVLCFP